ncbi:MAG: glycosyltransferase [Candidatus Aenigmarchaeota archaeon]|nr:glycosyltransferase [Candidatus Aenigmarchaeota archaeon]
MKSLNGGIIYSFIIPTRNEQDYLKGCMDSIKRQTASNWEIIVVDGLSQDGTVADAKQEGARIVYEKKKGPSVARNAGARAAKGSILIFTDADVRFPPDFIEKLGKMRGGCMFDLRFWDAGIVGNLILASWNIMLRLFMAAGMTATNGSCLAFDRKTFEQVGGFRDDLLTNEDHDIAIRTAKAQGFFFCPLKVLTSARRIRRTGILGYIGIHFTNTKNYMVHGASNPDYWNHEK